MRLEHPAEPRDRICPMWGNDEWFDPKQFRRMRLRGKQFASLQISRTARGHWRLGDAGGPLKGAAVERRAMRRFNDRVTKWLTSQTKTVLRRSFSFQRYYVASRASPYVIHRAHSRFPPPSPC